MSTINDTDVFLVNRGTASYKCQANQLLDKVIDTDFLLVNRGSTSYKVAFSNANDDILDTDWLLINRGSTSYKVSGADFKTLLGQVFGWENDMDDSALSFLPANYPSLLPYGIAVNDANETLVVGFTYQQTTGSIAAIGVVRCHNPDGTLKWTRRFLGEISTTQPASAATFRIYCQPTTFSNGDWAIGFHYDYKLAAALNNNSQNFERPPAFFKITRDGTVGTPIMLLSGREDISFIAITHQIHRRSNGKFAVYFQDPDYRAAYAELQSDLSYSDSAGRTRKYIVNAGLLNPTTSLIDVANDKMYACGTAASNGRNTIMKHTIESTSVNILPDWTVQYQVKDTSSGAYNLGVEGGAFSNGNPVFWVRERCVNTAGNTVDDITVFKLDNSDGSFIWGLRLGESRTAGTDKRNYYGNWHHEVASDDDGNIYLSITSNQGTVANSYWGFVVKINSSGTLQWSRRIRYTVTSDAASNPDATCMRVDKTGNLVFIFGDTLLKLKPDGVWAGNYSTSGYQPIEIIDWTWPFSTSATTGDFSLGAFSTLSSTFSYVTTSTMTGYSQGSISGWTQNNTNYVGQTFTVPG